MKRLFLLFSSGVVKDEDLRRGGRDGTRLSTVEPECVGGPHSVQWMDMGRSVLLADLLQLYQSQLLVFCTNALRLKLHTAAAGNAAGSINLQDDHRSFQTLHSVTHALETGNLHISSQPTVLHTHCCVFLEFSEACTTVLL